MKASLYCLIVLILVGGCRTSVNTQSHYVLNTERSGQDSPVEGVGVLDVHRLTIDRTYDSKGLVYKKSLHEYEIDYYNGFLVSPSQMITERVHHWLSNATLFARVLNPGSQALATHAIEGHIMKLYGDFQANEQANAVFEIQFLLIDHRDRTGQVLFNKTYMETQSMETHDASCLVHAFDSCLARVLKALEKDVAGVLE